jgi:hypothetical protein
MIHGRTSNEIHRLSRKGTSRMRMKGVHACSLVGIIVGATLFGWSDAEAVLCVKKNKKGAVTKVTIRGAACKGKESVGDPSVLLGLATPTTSSTTTTTLSPFAVAPRIVDSAGNDVGWMTNYSFLGVLAVRSIDDQAIAFPMRSVGPSVGTGSGYSIFDDFQFGFVHQGTQCGGEDRFTLESIDDAFIPGDMLKFALPSADGKSGYLFTPDVTELSNGSYSQDAFAFKCPTDADPTPSTVTCNDIDPPPSDGVATPVGAAFSCQATTALPTDQPITCSCIRCCVTRSVQPPDPPISLYRVQTVDLGLGNVTPPFKVQ